MLELIDVHTYYGENHVLQGVSLKVEEGSAVAILGRNGMGKTTTIHSIIGLTPPSHGIVRFKDKNINSLKPNKIAQMGIGLIPQGRRIFPSLSVKENLTMAARDNGRANAWSLEKIYGLFPVLRERASFKAKLLSGGEQQMLSIGRALMTNPELLLMDEPSEGLAPQIVREVGHIITQLNKEGLSILLVEQNLQLALDVSNYVYIIHKGKIVYESPTQAMNTEEVTPYLTIA